MMRLVNFSLVLLIIIAFFFGLNLGKRIQAIDTPIKTVITKIIVTKIVTPTPSLKPTQPIVPTKTLAE